MVEIGWEFFGKEIFKFSLFRYYLPLQKGRGPSFEQTLSLLCARFGSNWQIATEEEDENMKN